MHTPSPRGARHRAIQGNLRHSGRSALRQIAALALLTPSTTVLRTRLDNRPRMFRRLSSRARELIELGRVDDRAGGSCRTVQAVRSGGTVP
jgi:hypothetical protein